jgi:hypothetical protein
MIWSSSASCIGPVQFPDFSGIRVLMMPFLPRFLRASLPSSLEGWQATIASLCEHLSREGVAYLTIDERPVQSGGIHRRPGLHVDGWADEFDSGSWGGGGGWGITGLVCAASDFGSIAYAGEFSGEPQKYGNCAHLRSQARDAMPMQGGFGYSLGPLTVHETVPVSRSCHRQFIRISAPSDAAWPISCTPNPTGIKPTGPIAPARPSNFTNYAAA